MRKGKLSTAEVTGGIRHKKRSRHNKQLNAAGLVGSPDSVLPGTVWSAGDTAAAIPGTPGPPPKKGRGCAKKEKASPGSIPAKPTKTAAGPKHPKSSHAKPGAAEVKPKHAANKPKRSHHKQSPKTKLSNKVPPKTVSKTSNKPGPKPNVKVCKLTAKQREDTAALLAWASPRQGNNPSLIKTPTPPLVNKQKRRKIHCADLVQKGVMVEVDSPESLRRFYDDDDDGDDDDDDSVNVDQHRGSYSRDLAQKCEVVIAPGAQFMFHSNNPINTGFMYVCTCGKIFAKDTGRTGHTGACQHQKERVRRLEEVKATGIAPTIAQVKGSKMKFRPIQRGMFERIVIDGVTIDMAGTPFEGGKGPPVMVY